MSYFAAAFARSDGDWQVSELDLDEAESLEDLADVAQRVEPDDGLVILLVEEEDWFGVVRIEPDDDPRVYVSDAAETIRTNIGEVLLSELANGQVAGAGDGGGPALPPAPFGDAALLDDLGLAADDLNELAVVSGIPADAVAVVAERIGFADALEAVR